VAEIMAKAGFDWLAVDMEHSSLGIRDALEIVRIIDLCGVTPLVRLSVNDSTLIKRVLDGGAQGVIVPLVNTIGDAERAVSACRYPPVGQRGVGLARAQLFGEGFDEYFADNNDKVVVIVQIEHKDAVENIADILNVDGVDGLIIGPYDLSASLGIPGQFDHPRLKESLDRVLSAAQKAGKPAGFHVVSSDIERSIVKIEEGVQFLAYSLDTIVLNETFRAGLAALRSASKEHIFDES